MSDLSEFVTLSDTTLTTDSRRVAKHFGKRHDNVLRAFDSLECSPEFNRLKIEAVEELDEKGETRRVIGMTKVPKVLGEEHAPKFRDMLTTRLNAVPSFVGSILS